MPEEIEVPTEHLQESIEDKLHELAEERAEERAERAAEEKKNRWTFYLALGTALLSVFAALGAMEAGRLANDAVLSQIKASDSWSYYQAKGIKSYVFGAVAELESDAARSAKAQAKVARYEDEQKEIKKKAEELEADSRAQMERHERYSQAVTLLQIAIAVSAIAALARAKSIWYGSLALAAVGLERLVAAFVTR